MHHCTSPCLFMLQVHCQWTALGAWRRTLTDVLLQEEPALACIMLRNEGGHFTHSERIRPIKPQMADDRDNAQTDASLWHPLLYFHVSVWWPIRGLNIQFHRSEQGTGCRPVLYTIYFLSFVYLFVYFPYMFVYFYTKLIWEKITWVLCI